MSFSGISAADQDLARFLEGLDVGRRPSDIETERADAKEEPGRRDERGNVLPGPADLEQVARLLHRELACMANTPGGGAIVLGVADDGARTAVTVPAEDLRRRVYELSGGHMTPLIDEHHLADGARVLLCRVAQAVEPMRVDGRIRWRVGATCEAVDAASWASRLGVGGTDWSLDPSDRSTADVLPEAMAELRRILQGAGASGLAARPDHDVLRRIPNLIAEDGRHLTNGGRLLLTGIPVALDYTHRTAAGQNSTVRIEDGGPLLVQLRRVTDAIEARQRTVHVGGAGGAVIAQVVTLPQRAAREAIMNGLLHRDWRAPLPTRVEHVGDTLKVESPGGLVGSVTPENIITHQSTPRYRGLAETISRLGLVERQGVGVDVMYADLLAIGRPVPVIEELPAPSVRVTLVGGEPDAEWFRLRSTLAPPEHLDDLNVMLALTTALDRGFVSAPLLAPIIQDHRAIASTAIEALRGCRLGTDAVLTPIAGRPAFLPPSYRPSRAVRGVVRRRLDRVLSPSNRPTIAWDYARDAGRISSREASTLFGLSQAPAGEVLKQMAAEGLLAPSSPSGGGRGFHYTPIAD